MPVRVRRNVEMGFWSGGVFHPIRSSDDYDPEDVGEEYQYAPAKKKKKKKKNAGILSRKLPFFLPAKRKTRKKNAGANRRNPVRTEATVTGEGTDWISAKAVRVRKEGGRFKVEVKR
jgi:hypothetical protein